jgi:hypothetical protein
MIVEIYIIVTPDGDRPYVSTFPPTREFVAARPSSATIHRVIVDVDARQASVQRLFFAAIGGDVQ